MRSEPELPFVPRVIYVDPKGTMRVVHTSKFNVEVEYFGGHDGLGTARWHAYATGAEKWSYLRDALLQELNK